MTELNRDTVDFIFEYTKSATEKQFLDASALDSKTNLIFGIASGVVALTGLSAAVATNIAVGPGGTTTTSRADAPAVVIAFLIVALVAYVGVALCALLGWWVRDFYGSDYALTLWKEHWDEPPDEIRHMIAAGVPEIFDHNLTLINSKAAFINCAAIATAVEVIFSGAAIIALTI